MQAIGRTPHGDIDQDAVLVFAGMHDALWASWMTVVYCLIVEYHAGMALSPNCLKS